MYTFTTENISGYRHGKCQPHDTRNKRQGNEACRRILQDFIIKSAYVNIVGMYVSIFKTRYSIKLEDKYAGVSQKDIDAIIRNVGQFEVPEGYQIIDVVPSKFTTDSRVTDDPIGIFTDFLEAELDVMIADKNIVKSI